MGSKESEGGMVQGLMAITISILFASVVGLVILHFLPSTPF